MIKVTALFDSLQKKISSQFIRNLGWMGGAEILNRGFRLITTVVLARFLNPYDYGLAAIVITANEFIEVFSRNGVSAKLIQADETELDALCNSAYWLNWVVYVGLFIVQCLLAFPISWFYHAPQLILPICITAILYLTFPIAIIQATLIQRENRLKITAFNNFIQITGGNIITAILAALGLGMWAIVLTRLLMSPFWVLVNYTNHPWRPSKKFTTQHWEKIFAFGRSVLGSELLKTAVNNLDYLIVGRILGIQALGLYFFAFNAGLGVSLSIINAINIALLPHLCAARSEKSQLKKQYLSSIKTIAIIIIPIVILQSSLAPIYVPIVFGQKWVAALPVLILICLSAIPRPFADAASQLLIAVGKPNLMLQWNLIFTAIFITGIMIGVQWQVVGVATSVLLSHLIFLPLFTFWATRYVFSKAV
jgi:teichuronic acid exporter